MAHDASPPDSFPEDHTTPPDLLLIGHATRDLLPHGAWQLGGTVTFAALTAQRLGLRAAIVTSGPPDLLAALRAAAPGIALAAHLSAEATTFENIYTSGVRQQYLRGRAAPLTVAHVPAAWRAAPLVLLAPLAREVDPALAAAFPQALVAATPQGWLRRWDATGAVSPGTWDDAATVLPHLRALILSREDLVAAQPAAASNDAVTTNADADAIIADWARRVPLVVVTCGRDGALLLRDGGPPERFPGYAVNEVDPTGAGDVFATAFLCQLHLSGDSRAATDFANRVAALSVEHPGASGIPTPGEVAVRFGGSAR